MSLAYLPLDDRPCSKDFPLYLAQTARIKLKIAGSKSEFRNFFKSAGSAVLSVDRWVYGGLVESRKPGLTLQQTQERMRDLRDALGARGSAVSAFSVLMRQAPTAMTEAEEKKAELISIASRMHRNKTNLRAILKLFPQATWEEYLKTRKRNFAVNKKAVEFAKHGWISFLAVAMDDLAPEGLNREEARKLKQLIPKNGKKAQILPGTDEMGMLLLARYFLKSCRLSPKILVLYSHPNPDQFCLRYDSWPLSRIVRNQAELLGARLVKEAGDADLFFFVHSPQEDQQDVPADEPPARFSYRWMKMLQSFLIRGRPCLAADVRFANGADAGFMRTAGAYAPLGRLLGYAAWNTASNALGMALAQGAVRWGAERRNVLDLKKHENLLALRFLEDWLYQAELRPELLKRLRQEGRLVRKLDKPDAKHLAQEVRDKLNELAGCFLARHFPGLRVEEVVFPWNRLFDIEIKFKI